MILIIRFLPLIYFVLINLIAFVLFGIDKRRAYLNQWRISEKTLILLALLGGSLGAMLGMNVFRHKTQKPLFRWGIPAIVVLQLFIVALLVYFDLH